MTKVCLFTNYRTGSSYTIAKIAGRSNIPGIGEYFNHSNFGQDKSVYRLLPKTKDKFADHQFTFDTAFKNFSSMENGAALKLMGDHVDHDFRKLNAIVDQCDSIIYLYRRDFKAQMLSILAADYTKNYGPGDAMKWVFSMQDAHYNLARWKSKEEIEKRIEKKYKAAQTSESIITQPISAETIARYEKTLKDNYNTMAKFYKTHPGKLICLEDTKDQYPYKNNVTWENGKPDLNDFDVEGLFQ